MAILAEPEDARIKKPGIDRDQHKPRTEVYWRWRMQMAERIAAELDAEKFGVEAMYLIGSTKNANAGPNSDIDLLIHVRGDENQRRDLETWLQGWSLCLGEINYSRTGYSNRELLDVHFITETRTSLAKPVTPPRSAPSPTQRWNSI